MSTETQTRQKSGIRKKFAVPPVKVACLSCRSSRIRCDGKEPCSGCLHRDRECVYVQSRRGGARVPRPKRGDHEKADYLKIAQECFDESVPTMVKPGAGLTQLDLDVNSTDNLFDSIFTLPAATQPIEPQRQIPQQTGSVRRYGSDRDILDAYYVWIHPFFPILPPSEYNEAEDNPQTWFPESSNFIFESQSPVGLAISAILALVPHPGEDAPFHEGSVKVRREAAHALTRRTLERIESDSEMPVSAVSPAQALVNGQPSISRAALHPRVPIELEAVVALSMLSVYEYAQRGNITKMRDRASQALMLAMHLSLHDRGTELDDFAEARRRIWWMTYICSCQASIVSSVPPAIPLFDTRFTTSLPQSTDPEAWPFFIKSQQTILLATQFVSAVSRAVDGQEDWQDINNRMQELHSNIEPLIKQTEDWPDEMPRSTDSEAAIAYSLKQMSKIKLNSARIKLHRYSAFFDIPVFSEKHCDLKKSMPMPNDPLDQASLTGSPTRGCSQTLPTQMPPLSASVSPPNSTSSLSFSDDFIHPFPFSSHDSSRICLKSALSIAEAFQRLPLPQAHAGLGAEELQLLPRTMPSFACCAMQSAYALLMVYHRTWVVGQRSELANTLLSRCESGLKEILGALANYSIAFEALGGMRDQIQAALDCLSLPED